MDNTGLLPLVIDDFSGGKTDFFLGGKSNKQEVADNLVLTEKGDPSTRPGSELKYEVRINNTETIKNIIDNQNEILMQHGKSIKYVLAGSSTEILSPQSHNLFVGGTDDLSANFTYWNKHTLGVSDVLKSPQKIYKNEADTWTLTTLGLPDIMYATCVNLANDIKSKYEAHRIRLTQHLVADGVNEITSPNASDMASLFTLVDELKVKIQGHFDDAALVTPIYHTATFARTITSNTPTGLVSIYKQLVAIREGFNLHDNGDSVHTLQNLSQVAATLLEPSASGTAGTSNYVYGLQYTYRYSVGDTEFLERGPIKLLEVPDINAPDVDTVTISNIPTLISGANENWDDSDILVTLYRTVADGNILYYLKDITSGTGSTTDEVTDDDLQLNPTAYTEGGVLDNEMPTPAKYIKTVNDITYFGGAYDGRAFKGNRLKSSKPGIPSASPGSFYLDFEDDIMGLGVFSTYPLVFLNKALYKIEGFFDSTGRGGMTKRSVSQRVGTVSHRSIVNTKDGCYFAAEDGFYFTDGNSCRKISNDINLSYKALVNKDQIVGAYDSLRNRVLWSVNTDDSFDTNDQIYVAFLDYRTEFNGHPFYTWSGGRDATNFSASALAYIDGELLRADHRGYLLVHDDAILDDTYIDTSLSPANFYTQTIFYDLTSVAFDFGNPQTRKWVSKININAENTTSLSLNIETSNDNSDVYVELKPVLENLNVEWGEPGLVWGEAPLRWNYNPVISKWRWMNAGEQNLRCMYKQVKFSNAYAEIDNSNFIGPASTNSGTKAITLLSYPTTEWIGDPVNYYISFDTDDYNVEYLITGISGGVLTVSDDDNNLATDASANWKIKGYKKRQVLNLLNYVFNYRTISMTQETYRG